MGTYISPSINQWSYSKYHTALLKNDANMKDLSEIDWIYYIDRYIKVNMSRYVSSIFVYNRKYIWLKNDSI